MGGKMTHHSKRFWMARRGTPTDKMYQYIAILPPEKEGEVSLEELICITAEVQNLEQLKQKLREGTDEEKDALLLDAARLAVRVRIPVLKNLIRTNLREEWQSVKRPGKRTYRFLKEARDAKSVASEQYKRIASMTKTLERSAELLEKKLPELETTEEMKEAEELLNKISELTKKKKRSDE
jgi:hypothetical protein